MAFYRLWFPASHPLAASRQPYPASLPDVLAQFGGVDYVDDLTKLKSLLGNLGELKVCLYIPLIAVCLQITQIHQHQPVDTVIERRIAAEIDKLHAAGLA